MNQIEAITSYLNSDDPELRRRAVIAAGQVRGQEAEAILLANLHDTDNLVRYEAVNVLVGRVRQHSISSRITTALAQMLNEYDGWSRIAIAESLIRVVNLRRHGVVDPLMPYGNTESRQVLKDNFMYTEYDSAYDRAVYLLLDGLANDDHSTRQSATDALEHTLLTSSEYSLPSDIYVSVAYLLDSSYAEARAGAVALLGRAAPEIAIKPLLAALSDEDARVREAAIYALDKQCYMRAAETIFRLGCSDESANVRYAATYALCHLTPTLAIDLIGAGTLNSLDEEQEEWMEDFLYDAALKGMSSEAIAKARNKLQDIIQVKKQEDVSL